MLVGDIGNTIGDYGNFNMPHTWHRRCGLLLPGCFKLKRSPRTLTQRGVDG